MVTGFDKFPFPYYRRVGFVHRNCAAPLEDKLGYPCSCKPLSPSTDNLGSPLSSLHCCQKKVLTKQKALDGKPGRGLQSAVWQCAQEHCTGTGQHKSSNPVWVAYTHARLGPGLSWTRVNPDILSSKNQKGVPRAVSRLWYEPIYVQEHTDQNTSKFNEDMSEGESFCPRAAWISIVTGGTGCPPITGIFWLCRCELQGKEKQNCSQPGT